MRKMPLNIIFGSLLIFCMFFFLWSALLWFFMGFDLNTVRPWSAPIFAFQFWGAEEYARKISLSGGISAALALYAGYEILFRKNKNYHGNSQFATRSDLVKQNMLDKSGIILGQTEGFLGFGKEILRSDADKHILVAAPTDSGKTSAIIKPNVDLAPQSRSIY